MLAVETVRRGTRHRKFQRRRGQQCTVQAFTGWPDEAGVRISMDGQDRCTDNVFIERPWRSLKYGGVYSQDLPGGSAARGLVGECRAPDKRERPHSAPAGAEAVGDAVGERGGEMRRTARLMRGSRGSSATGWRGSSARAIRR